MAGPIRHLGDLRRVMENQAGSCYIRYGLMPRGPIPRLKIRARRC